jgi:hypothetical protein
MAVNRSLTESLVFQTFEPLEQVYTQIFND